ncbi:hypothetical protein AUG19_04510 [archaeon 13_1_20CM_2_54_9]|nr:MAG: hypothetical protein AUG19_04510 [archaeon 13_1_20CM_2_54_9]
MVCFGERSFDTEMSKLQTRETSAFSDIANTTLADQVESRLKELERNIAVARQFIKLADECSSQVRHEWDLLQQDIRTESSETNRPHVFTEHPKKHETNPRLEGFRAREKTKHKSEDEFKNETEDTSDSITGTDMTPKPSKRHGSKRKETVSGNETKGPTLTSKNSSLAKSRPKR